MVKKKLRHVIFLQGLGDNKPNRVGLNCLAWLWGKQGLKITVCHIGWADSEPFNLKLDRLIKDIDSLYSQHAEVSLVGTSAGASLALNAYSLAQEKIHRLVYISGKLRNPENVNPRYFKKNPAFKQSLYLSEANFQKLTDQDKRKMLYLHALRDTLVPPKLNKPTGIRSRAVLAFGHVVGIFTALIFYSPIIAKFIKS